MLKIKITNPIKWLAYQILKKEINVNNTALQLQSKYISLVTSEIVDYQDKCIELNTEMGEIVHQNIYLFKENKRLNDRFVEIKKTYLPKGLFKAIADYLPDPNYVASFPLEKINEQLAKMSVMYYSDSLGVHEIAGRVFENERNYRYNSDNPSHILISIPDYVVRVKIELIKREVNLCANGVNTSVLTYVWALGDNVQLISEQAWETTLAFAKVQKELLQ